MASTSCCVLGFLLEVGVLCFSCILDSCTISASYEVSEAQKALLLLLRTEKGSSTSSEEHMPTYRTLLTTMTFMSRRSRRVVV